MRRRKSEFISLNDIIKSVLSKRDLNASFGFYKVKTKWENIVGKMIANHSEPIKLTSGKLVLGVDHTEWMQQLRQFEKIIIDKVNGVMGKKAVRSLFFINMDIDRLKSEWKTEIEHSEDEYKPPMNISLSEKKKIARIVKDIPDSKLKISLFNLFKNISGR